MRGWCFNAVVGGLALAGSAVAAGDAGGVSVARPVGTTMPNVDACVARLDPQLDIGYERISARCPELMRQLEAGAWAPWLPRGWKESGNDLSAGGLKEFRELVARESGARDPPAMAAPDVRNLQSILTALADSQNETGWSRFKSWLRSILERREQPTDESWFARMVSQAGLSQSVIRLISYGALAVVVVLAGIIVVNEAQTAGLLSRRRAAARQRAQTVDDSSGVGWSAIEQSPLLDRPRLLLELIVRRLGARGFLPPAGALTVRELTGAARLPDVDDRARLAELAFAAERVRYSPVGPDGRALEKPIVRGRELLERLEAGMEDRRVTATDEGRQLLERLEAGNGDSQRDTAR